MRATPPLLIHLDTFRVWRAGIVVTVSMAAAALSMWAFTAPEGRAVLAWVALAVGLIGIATSAHWLWTVPARPRQLLWDGQAWHVSAVRPDGIDKTMTGSVEITVDAGAWMLLRFRPDPWLAVSAAARRRAVWLPAERSAAMQDWHALRYTLYGSAHRSRLDTSARPPGQAQ